MLTIAPAAPRLDLRTIWRAAAWADQERALQVDPEHPVEIGFAQVEESAPCTMPALLTRQSLEPQLATVAATSSRPRPCRRHRSGRSVRHQGADLLTARLPAPRSRPRSRPGAPSEQAPGDCESDSFRPAGDDGHFVPSPMPSPQAAGTMPPGSRRVNPAPAFVRRGGPPRKDRNSSKHRGAAGSGCGWSKRRRDKRPDRAVEGPQ
jgi:hypothetical protein